MNPYLFFRRPVADAERGQGDGKAMRKTTVGGGIGQTENYLE